MRTAALCTTRRWSRSEGNESRNTCNHCVQVQRAASAAERSSFNVISLTSSSGRQSSMLGIVGDHREFETTRSLKEPELAQHLSKTQTKCLPLCGGG